MSESLFKNRLLISAIVISGIAHLVIGVFLYRAQQDKKINNTVNNQLDTIKATLIFHKPEPKPAPTIAPEQPATIESQSKFIESTKDTAPLEDPINNQQPTVQKPESNIDTKAKTSNEFKAPQPKINQQFTGNVGQHLQSLHQQQTLDLAKEASRQYQIQKNSPNLQLPAYKPPLTEDEKILEKTKIRANCDGVTRKTTAVLLSFMGARIDCTENPDIKDFIQKRVNKTPPTNQKSTYKTPPKSVVITQ